MSEEKTEATPAEALRLAGDEVIGGLRAWLYRIEERDEEVRKRHASEDETHDLKRLKRIAEDSESFRLRMLEIETGNRAAYEHERISRLRALFDRETVRLRAKLDGKVLDERDADIEAAIVAKVARDNQESGR